MASKTSTQPGWQSLGDYCSTCLYSAVCPLNTLGEVENCVFVRDQRRYDLEQQAGGGQRFLPQSPYTYADTVVRDRRGHRRELDYTKTHRGRRPLNAGGVELLLEHMFLGSEALRRELRESKAQIGRA